MKIYGEISTIFKYSDQTTKSRKKPKIATKKKVGPNRELNPGPLAIVLRKP